MCRYGRVTGMGTGNVSYTNVTVVYDSNTTVTEMLRRMLYLVIAFEAYYQERAHKHAEDDGPVEVLDRLRLKRDNSFRSKQSMAHAQREALL